MDPAEPPDRALWSDSPKVPLIVGTVALLAMLGGLVGWGSAMSVAGASIASGQVAVEGSRKAIQHRDGGPVAAVLVREGQRVRKGQPLIELDLTDARADVAVLSGAKALAQYRLARLRAEASGSDTISWPVPIDQTDPKIQAAVEQETRLFVARRSAYLGNIQLLTTQIRAREEQIEGLKARSISVQRQLGTVQSELDAIRPLLESGIVTRPRILALERAAAGFQGDLETLQNNIAAERSAMVQAQGQIAQLEKDRRESIARDTSESEARLAEVEPRLVSAMERLTRGTLLSPDDGFVYNLSVFSSGAVLVPGQTVLEIVPLEDNLVLMVDINPADFERVRVGQQVIIHLTPYTQRWQSIIHGELIKISADRFEDAAKQRSFYRGVIKPDPLDVKRAGIELAPGMPAQVMIQTEQRTILAYFATRSSRSTILH